MNRRRTFRVVAAALLLMALTAAPAVADVLVFGGTGQLGVRIVKRLVAAGEDVTVFVRPTSDRGPLEDLDVDYVVGDMRNDDDVANAFAAGPYDEVIVAVRAPLDQAGFYADSTARIVAGAQRAGVSQIIYHGAVGAGDNMEAHPDIPWASVPGLVARMEDQGQAEQMLLDSGINVTIIRNSRVWPDEMPASGHAELTEDQSVLTPITRADLAAFTMDCLDNPACYGKIYHARDTTLSWPPS